MSTLTLFVVVVAVLLPLLHRDLKRADEKRRRREWIRTNPKARELARKLNELSAQISTQLLPATRQAAQAVQRFTDAVKAADRSGK